MDRSAADAMKPAISKGYHLGSVSPLLVKLSLSPPLPSLPPSCVSPSPRLSAWQYPFIKTRLTGIHRIHGTCTHHTDVQIRLKGDPLCFYIIFLSSCVLHMFMCMGKVLKVLKIKVSSNRSSSLPQKTPPETPLQ